MDNKVYDAVLIHQALETIEENLGYKAQDFTIFYEKYSTHTGWTLVHDGRKHFGGSLAGVLKSFAKSL